MNACHSLVPRRVLSALVALAIAAGAAHLDAQSTAALPVGETVVIGQLSIDGGPPVPIHGFSFDIRNPVPSAGGGGGIAILSEIAIVKQPDALSTSLYRSTLQGAHLAAVRIDVYQSGRSVIASTFELSDVLVTSFGTTGAQGEAVTFHFNELVFSTAGQSFCWNAGISSPC